jgi:hypothetical protein
MHKMYTGRDLLLYKSLYLVNAGPDQLHNYRMQRPAQLHKKMHGQIHRTK